MLNEILKVSIALALTSSVAVFATPTPDAMRAASAVQQNSLLSTSINVTRDPDTNVVSFHVNGVNPTDAEILLKREASPLSSEYTVVTGKNRDGSTCCYMMPSNVATAQVIESVSKDLVNAGNTQIEITQQKTGRN